MYLHAHCDEEALLILFGHNPKAQDHLGAYRVLHAPARVAELLDKYPGLWGELSYRSGITDGGGKLYGRWRELFASHSDRFLIGSDTWINERWFAYDDLMREISRLARAAARRPGAAHRPRQRRAAVRESGE